MLTIVLLNLELASFRSCHKTCCKSKHNLTVFIFLCYLVMLDTYKCGYCRHIHVKCKVYPGLLGAGLFFLKLVRNSLYIHSGGALYVVT